MFAAKAKRRRHRSGKPANVFKKQPERSRGPQTHTGTATVKVDEVLDENMRLRAQFQTQCAEAKTKECELDDLKLTAWETKTTAGERITLLEAENKQLQAEITKLDNLLWKKYMWQCQEPPKRQLRKQRTIARERRMTSAIDTIRGPVSGRRFLDTSIMMNRDPIGFVCLVQSQMASDRTVK
jgi:hypothetical protein